MTNPPSPTPVEIFRDIINRLMRAVETQRIVGRLAMPLKILVAARITAIRVRFYRLAEQIAAGTYKPRRPSTAPRRKPANPRPWQPSKLPTRFGWLYTLVPTENYRLSVVGPRSQLATLLQDPGMAAVMEAAPGALRRPLRSLCWMLRVTPPPILANPRRPSRPRVPPTPAPATPKAKPRRPQPPPNHPERAASSPSPLAGEGRGEGSPRTRDPPHPA